MPALKIARQWGGTTGPVAFICFTVKLNIKIAEPREPMESSVILTEARARIIWGEPASSVRGYLIANGVSDIDADAKIKEFCAERNAEIRRLGIKSTLIGVALTGAAGIMLYLVFAGSHIGSSTASRARGFGGILLMGGYGLWKLVNGIVYLVRPQSEKESITEISE